MYLPVVGASLTPFDQAEEWAVLKALFAVLFFKKIQCSLFYAKFGLGLAQVLGVCVTLIRSAPLSPLRPPHEAAPPCGDPLARAQLQPAQAHEDVQAVHRDSARYGQVRMLHNSVNSSRGQGRLSSKA